MVIKAWDGLQSRLKLYPTIAHELVYCFVHNITSKVYVGCSGGAQNEHLSRAVQIAKLGHEVHSNINI